MGLSKFLVKFTEVSKDHPNGRPGRSMLVDANTQAEAFKKVREKADYASNKGKGVKYTDLKTVKKFPNK